MNVGTLCFATQRGLGYLAKSFYDNGIVNNVVVLEHSTLPTQTQWYNCEIVKNPRASIQFLKEFIEQQDLMLFFETPFDWELISICKQVGTKSVLMTMYECTPAVIPHTPDLFLCPSLLDMEIFSECRHNRATFIPVPVDVSWNLRTKAKRFVHNSGHIGLRNRSGTDTLLQSIKHIESPIELTIRSQSANLYNLLKQYPDVLDDSRVTIFVGNHDYLSLREGFDVCVSIEKFNGLSLPLQECRAAGMLVITTDRFPTNTWLPVEPLVPVSSYSKARVGSNYMTFEEANVDPIAVAKTIDEWYDKDITEYSLSGKVWAEENSWKVLKPQYIKVFESLF